MTDLELVRASRTENEQAFEEIVRRYSSLVYASAVRRVDMDHGLAQDVTQSVFIILHRKLQGLNDEIPLAGWLLKTTSYVSRRAMTAQFRRQRMEAEVLKEAESTAGVEGPPGVPFLDDALMALKPQEQRCVCERFFAEASFKEIAEREEISEDAAQKRVTRALEKMRSFLVRRGVVLGGTAAVSSCLVESAKAGPADLCSNVVASVTAAAAGKGTSIAALLASLTLSSLWKRQFLVLALKVGIGLAVVSPVSWWMYNQSNTTHALRPPARPRAAPTIALLATQWSGLMMQAAALNQSAPPPGNATATESYQARLNALYSESSRVMGELYNVLSTNQAQPALAEFFSLELTETLKLNQSQQSTVSNLVSSVIPANQDAMAGFSAVDANRNRMVPQIRGLLDAAQTQRFDSIYRPDGLALFTVASLSVQFQQAK